MRTVTCLMMYMYNTEPDDIFDAVYGADKDPQYRADKLPLCQAEKIVTFWGQLDTKHQVKLLQAAVVKYGDEVDRRK